jgi:hypothetical protein
MTMGSLVGTLDAPAQVARDPLYRDQATGTEWQGSGPKPKWLRDRIREGAKLEELVVEGGHPVGMLQVWWVPQLPMQAFSVSVASVEEGVKVLDVLAMYDLFQLQHNVKPDFANTGGLRRWCADSDGEGTPGWEEWYDPDTAEDDPRAWTVRRASDNG